MNESYYAQNNTVKLIIAVKQLLFLNFVLAGKFLGLNELNH